MAAGSISSRVVASYTFCIDFEYRRAAPEQRIAAATISAQCFRPILSLARTRLPVSAVVVLPVFGSSIGSRERQLWRSPGVGWMPEIVCARQHTVLLDSGRPFELNVRLAQTYDAGDGQEAQDSAIPACQRERRRPPFRPGYNFAAPGSSKKRSGPCATGARRARVASREADTSRSTLAALEQTHAASTCTDGRRGGTLGDRVAESWWSSRHRDRHSVQQCAARNAIQRRERLRGAGSTPERCFTDQQRLQRGGPGRHDRNGR